MQKTGKIKILLSIFIMALFCAYSLETNSLIFIEAQDSVNKETALISNQNSEKASRDIGISDGASLLYMSQEELDEHFQDLKELEIKYIRYDADWSVIQSHNSREYDWTKTDRIVETATRNGVESLMIITYAPGWAQRIECRDQNHQCQVASNETFARFAGEVAKRYKGQVHDFEIWNEPNYGTTNLPRNDAKAYAELLQTTYKSIKKENPEANILTGGLAMCGNDGISTAPVDFIASLYDSGAKGYFDGIALHPHTYPGAPESPYDWNGWKTISAIRDIMIANADSEKKIWISEYGAPTGGPGTKQEIGEMRFFYGRDFMSEQAQKEMMEQALKLYQETDYIAALYIYNLRDKPDESTAEHFFGLIRADGSKKPAYDVVQLHT